MTQKTESPKTKSYRIQNLLSEGVLGFFALVSLFLGLVPSVFKLTSGDRILLSIAEISIIVLFAYALFTISGYAKLGNHARIEVIEKNYGDAFV